MAVAKTGFPAIWIHGKSIRVEFMRRGVRHQHMPGLLTPPKQTSGTLRACAVRLTESAHLN